MRNLLTSATEVAGAALIVRGLGLAWEPLGFISAGCALLAGSVLVMRR